MVGGHHFMKWFHKKSFFSRMRASLSSFSYKIATSVNLSKELCYAEDNVLVKIFIAGGPIRCRGDSSEPASRLRPSYLAHMSPTKGRSWAMTTKHCIKVKPSHLFSTFAISRAGTDCFSPLVKSASQVHLCWLVRFRARFIIEPREISLICTIVSNRRWHLGRHRGERYVPETIFAESKSR